MSSGGAEDLDARTELDEGKITTSQRPLFNMVAHRPFRPRYRRHFSTEDAGPVVADKTFGRICPFGLQRLVTIMCNTNHGRYREESTLQSRIDEQLIGIAHVPAKHLFFATCPRDTPPPVI